jgi:hypothetical protein
MVGKMRLDHIKWEFVPKQTARNSYDLLIEVIKAIKEEPLRIQMENYTSSKSSVVNKPLPECGTQGCIAGWMGILHVAANAIRPRGAYTLQSRFIESLIPFSLRHDFNSLVMGNYPYPFPSWGLNPPDYADSVIANIESFMRQHVTELRNMTSPTLSSLLIRLINAGVKNGPLPKSDFLVDCRSVANPFHVPALGALTGDDLKIQLWVRDHSNVKAIMATVEEAISRIPVRRNNQPDPYKEPFEICCFCAHGIHRSRAMKHIIASELNLKGYTVEVK